MHIPRSECSVKGIFYMDNIKSSNVLLSVHNDTRPAHIASTSNHNNVPSVKFHKVRNLAQLEVIFNRIVDPDSRIGITNCASIVGNDVGNATITNSYSADF